MNRLFWLVSLVLVVGCATQRGRPSLVRADRGFPCQCDLDPICAPHEIDVEELVSGAEAGDVEVIAPKSAGALRRRDNGIDLKLIQRPIEPLGLRQRENGIDPDDIERPRDVDELIRGWWARFVALQSLSYDWPLVRTCRVLNERAFSEKSREELR